MTTKLQQRQKEWRSNRFRIAGSISNLRTIAKDCKVYQEDEVYTILDKLSKFLNKVNDKTFELAGGTIEKKEVRK